MTPKNARLLIIADDLTGALDAAAPFAGRGLVTDVALTPAALGPLLAGPAEVIAVSTQSREIAAEAARAVVAGVAKGLPTGIQIFKKVDSRLKGHVAVELAALDPQSLFVAPAIPDFDRIVTSGAVRGFGVDQPIDIASVLGSLAGRSTIPDTETPADMLAVLATAPAEAMLVGARGLAEALAIRMTGKAAATPPRPRASRAIFAVGSRDPITMAQVRTLRDSGRALWLDAPNGRLVSDAPPAPLRLLQATPGTEPATGPEVAGALAQSLHPRLTADADLLLLTGGATAEAVLGAMGIHNLRLSGDVLPGLPLAHSDTGLAIVAKSGGFGDALALLRLADILDGDQL